MVRAAIYKAPIGSVFHMRLQLISFYIYMYDETKKTAAGGEIKVTYRHQFVFTTP